MKLLIVFAFCISGTVSCWRVPSTIAVKWMDVPIYKGASGRIIDGSSASVGQFPWQVVVFGHTAAGQWICGGSLISADWVLTAAHCVEGAWSFTLLLGGISLSKVEDGRLILSSTNAIIHKNYNNQNFNNDIGLIRLPVSVAFSERLQPVTLAARDDFVDAGRLLTVSGWGRTSDASPYVSKFLNYVGVTAISNTQCGSVYGSSVVVSSTLCTNDNPKHGSCRGDSGGPLVSVDSNGSVTQVGVVSFGAADGCEIGAPSGFARVQSFLDWIAANTGLNV